MRRYLNITSITGPKSLTIRLEQDAVTHFKSLTEETGIPYQSLINLCLRDCAASKKKTNLTWA